ncbi:M14 family metallopeptidase [uncultured Umboniibacter sp.]|uniref:M14 family metallopeptidase n=1 Tax=uncultured Umboniibacter sp. TaxID=1798917 RepID=UPI00260CED9E|nr:M14 family metallopeptidase [uncultured Umboniibacter sp.]
MVISRASFALSLCLIASTALGSDELMAPQLDADLQYSVTILDGDYQPDITKPEEVLGYPVGYHRMASPAQISTLFTRWDAESERMKLVQYATSHEGRPLYVAYISSPKNLAKLDEFQQMAQQLAHPDELSAGQIDGLIEQMPATAWMAYSIHGNETSGADAAVAASYHLIADQSEDTQALLADMIVMIDPMMNPDGRARFSKTLEQFRGTAPNVDDQSLLHSGDWPFGRMNHYLFDLNRDFFYLTQPESRGRVALINDWYPQLMIDGHEMGAQDTFLMGPPREPINNHVPATVKSWSDTFAEEQAAAFDSHGWRYYTGEWFENLYTGYSNYAEYRGSIHILYEQSRMAEDGVRRPEGTVQTYAESVHHQYVSTFANLESLATHTKAIYRDFVELRRVATASRGEYANRSYVILPTDNESRLNQLVEKLNAQDIQVFKAERELSVGETTTQSGRVQRRFTIPEGSLVIPNRQPEARLIAAIMEFDAYINDEVLRGERNALLQGESSLMYDTTAWNLTMMYGLESVVVSEHIDSGLSRYELASAEANSVTEGIAFVVDGADDLSLAFAARLMERGVEVRASDIGSTYGSQNFNAGSIMVTRADNPNLDVQELVVVADELGLSLVSIETGFGEGDLPEWGGSHFPLLEQPQIALLSHMPTSPYVTGSTWFAIDSMLGIRHSQIHNQQLSYMDLRRYNLIIVPPTWGAGMSEGSVAELQRWVEQGGTLITLGGASRQFAGADFTQTALLNDSLESVEPFDRKVYEELMAEHHQFDLSDTKSHTLPTDVVAPWVRNVSYPPVSEIVERDRWNSRFMPRGSFVTGRVDADHWLSFGAIAEMPLLYSSATLMMPSGSAEAVIRAGHYQAPQGSLSDALIGEWQNIGWTSVPTNSEVSVRMSGLLWPEAAQRIVNTGYLVREQVGSGQIIMFANEANFRGAALGTQRLLLNAIVLGPGMGTEPRILL